jgi:flagellar hook assembly protein FlgD
MQNYPNPFNPTTTIRFELPIAGNAELLIYDVLGREVKTIVTEVLTAGSHTATWNGTNEKGGEVSSGVYFYRLTVRSSQGLLYTQTKKMLLLR